MAYTGQLYQLESKRHIPDGAYVQINGPWDTYGVVTSSEKKGNYYLNQIRGVKARPGEKPVCSW